MPFIKRRCEHNSELSDDAIRKIKTHLATWLALSLARIVTVPGISALAFS
jgi:hypothetical protein